MKSFLFCLLTCGFATLFTCCSKEVPEVPSSSNDQAPVKERGVCSVTVEAINCYLDLCGTQTSNTSCGNSGNTILLGTESLKDGMSETYTLITPTVFRASVEPGAWGPGALVRVTSNGVTRFFPITGFPTSDVGAVDIAIDNDCNIQ
jgi:hypothetical protein